MRRKTRLDTPTAKRLSQMREKGIKEIKRYSFYQQQSKKGFNYLVFKPNTSEPDVKHVEELLPSIKKDSLQKNAILIDFFKANDHISSYDTDSQKIYVVERY